jgi:hypothetical protein
LTIWARLEEALLELRVAKRVVRGFLDLGGLPHEHACRERHLVARRRVTQPPGQAALVRDWSRFGQPLSRPLKRSAKRTTRHRLPPPTPTPLTTRPTNRIPTQLHSRPRYQPPPTTHDQHTACRTPAPRRQPHRSAVPTNALPPRSAQPRTQLHSPQCCCRRATIPLLRHQSAWRRDNAFGARS